ncbi:phosphonate C-P lyase system protein PhnH [Crenobacter cavernae]|nr:phosphonate C-P lyase system protein PhnH [Crenobacter cavernae]
MLIAAFENPVDDAQSTFRTLLSALAEPLLPRALPVLPDAPAGLTPAGAALLLTLCDADTAVWLPPQLLEAADYLRFHAGARLVADVADADFVYIPHGAALPDLASLKNGSVEYPDRSATLIIDAEGFSKGDGETSITGSGPGFAAPRKLDIKGLAEPFWPDWRAAASRFPQGVDVFFVAGDKVVGLPRTTRIEGR